MHAAVRVLLIVAVLILPLVGEMALAAPVRVPRTLAATQPVRAEPVVPGFPIDFVAVTWRTGLPIGGLHRAEVDQSHAAHDAAVRLRRDGRWGPWTLLVEDGADALGQWASGLVSAGDADAYQVRGVPAGARQPRAVAINTTDGSPVTVGWRRPGSVGALTRCRSRADWGADESLRYAADGAERWAPAFQPLQVLTVHHTATANDAPDPAATVRAIYRYHAVDRGWGDIGYQLLVDADGVTYEGRWSGDASRSCLTHGGDGHDFAHDSADRLVTAAHVAGANSGNLGVALLGTYTDVEPPGPQHDGLVEALAELSNRHDLDPQGTVGYVNPVDGSDRTVPTISGHRDWTATECPGGQLYAALPRIRDAVAARTGSPPAPAPVAQVTAISQSLTRGKRPSLVVDVTATADGAPLVGATVALRVDRDGAPYATATTTTDPAGLASFRFSKVPRGCFTEIVTAVTADGTTWDGTSPAPSPEQLCR